MTAAANRSPLPNQVGGLCAQLRLRSASDSPASLPISHRLKPTPSLACWRDFKRHSAAHHRHPHVLNSVSDRHDREVIEACMRAWQEDHPQAHVEILSH
jgi:hypothetical protein